jgi:tetratricopeptide (TPR) repeat protein
VRKAWLIPILFLLLGPLWVPAQDVTGIQKDAERLEKTNMEAAFRKYQELLTFQPLNLNALCKSSELCSSLGHRQAQKSARIDYYHTARRYAEIALRINPNFAEANFVMAVAMGRIALVAGGREKIQAVNDIKKYAERAIQLDPNNFKAYHVLGKWNYEVSSLNGMERAAAKVFYGGLPSASIQEAIRNYETSRLLNPDFNLNYLELAKSYLRVNRKDLARSLLSKLIGMSFKTEDDARIREEGQKILKEIQ